MTTPTDNHKSILLQLLRDDHPQPWTCTEIEAVLDDLSTHAIRDALAHLGAEGVVVLDGEQVQASRVVRSMDALGMVCV